MHILFLLLMLLLPARAEEYAGIAAMLTRDVDADVVRVVALVEGGGAAEAGLDNGDVLTSVDGEPVAGRSIEEVVGDIRGPVGSTVTLGIRRGDEERTVTATRQTVEASASADLRFLGFYEQVPDGDFCDLLDEVLDSSASDFASMQAEGAPTRVRPTVLGKEVDPTGAWRAISVSDDRAELRFTLYRGGSASVAGAIRAAFTERLGACLGTGWTFERRDAQHLAVRKRGDATWYGHREPWIHLSQGKGKGDDHFVLLRVERMSEAAVARIDKLRAEAEAAEAAEEERERLRALAPYVSFSAANGTCVTEGCEAAEEGRFRTLDGAVYTGPLAYGMAHGEGTLEDDGSTWKGTFRHGEFHGEVTRTWPDGGREVGRWEDGRFLGHAPTDRPRIDIPIAEALREASVAQPTSRPSSPLAAMVALYKADRQAQGWVVLQEENQAANLYSGPDVYTVLYPGKRYYVEVFIEDPDNTLIPGITISGKGLDGGFVQEKSTHEGGVSYMGHPFYEVQSSGWRFRAGSSSQTYRGAHIILYERP